MKSLDFNTIGANIKARRKSKGLTQEYVGNQLDVNASHISNIEGGRAHASLTALVCIANVLECSVDYFIHDEYTFTSSAEKNYTIDEKISKKLEYLDMDKKILILKMLDIL